MCINSKVNEADCRYIYKVELYAKPMDAGPWRELFVSDVEHARHLMQLCNCVVRVSYIKVLETSKEFRAVKAGSATIYRRTCALPTCTVSTKGFQCGGCDVYYCGPEHQKEHWADHKAACKPFKKAAAAAATSL